MSYATNITNLPASSDSLEAAGSAIVGGYNGSSIALRVLIVLLPTLAMYNAIELLVLIFFTFTKYRGLYFWSLVVSSIGIIPYSLGFLFKFNNITTGGLRWLSVVLLTIGWYLMVTGQSVVLWSRLHLVMEGEKGDRTLRWTKWMIIVDAIILHIPTTVLTFGSNGDLDTAVFARGYSVMEKIQMSGFFVQEVILSSIYITSAINILKTSNQMSTRRIMYQLLAINILILIMDLALLGLEAASLYLLETITKGVFYSIKLKLEFAILGRLVQFVGRPGSSLGNDERVRKASVAFTTTNGDDKYNSSSGPAHPATGIDDISDFVDLAKVKTDVTHAAAGLRRPSQASTIQQDGLADTTGQHRCRTSSIRLRPGVSAEDIDFAMFQHAEDAFVPSNKGFDDCEHTVTEPRTSLTEAKQIGKGTT